MKKVLLTILAVVIVMGVLTGAGFAGYRIGYIQGVRTTSDGVAPSLGRDRLPQFHPGIFDRGFDRGMIPNRSFMMQRDRGFGFFSPFQFLWRIALLGLVLWLGYMLFKGSGWHLTLNRQHTGSPKAEPVIPDETPKSGE